MTGGPVLEADRLKRRFGEVRAVQGLSLSVNPGELYGLVGPDGAGKTTAIRCLVGLLPLDGGSVRILGRDPARSRSVRESLGYMPQAYSLYADLTVAENLRFFGRLFTLPREEFRRRSRRLLEVTRLAPFTERRAGALSGGMYKKLALACALLPPPELPPQPADRRQRTESRKQLKAHILRLVMMFSSGISINIYSANDPEADNNKESLQKKTGLQVEG